MNACKIHQYNKLFVYMYIHTQIISVVTTMCAAEMRSTAEITCPGLQIRSESTRSVVENSMQPVCQECMQMIFDKSIKVTYIPAHTGHKSGPEEQKFLPLPPSVRETVSLKLSQGITTKRILQGQSLRLQQDSKQKQILYLLFHRYPQQYRTRRKPSFFC